MTSTQLDKQTPTVSSQGKPTTEERTNIGSIVKLDSGTQEKNSTRLYADSSHAKSRPHFKTTDVNTPLVLHVDDDPDLVDAVTSRFRASGFRVASALDGVTGMKTAMMYSANAIILDYDMPNGRGDTVIDLLKANDKTKDIPIVVLTAVHKKGLKRELLNKGADKFMTKPFEFDQLKSTVSSLIGSNE